MQFQKYRQSLGTWIGSQFISTTSMPTQEVSDNEKSADLAVDTLDEGQDLRSQVPEEESPDSGSVSERLPSSTRSSSSSPVEETQHKEGAKVIKKKRAWSS